MFISERRKKTSLYFNHCMSWHLICIQISNVHLSTNIWCQCLMQSFHFMLYSMHFFLIVRLQSRERERDRLFLIYLNGAIWIARRCSVHWINGSLLFTLVTIYYVRLLNEYIKYWNTNLLLLFEFRAVFIAVSCAYEYAISKLCRWRHRLIEFDSKLKLQQLLTFPLPILRWIWYAWTCFFYLLQEITQKITVDIKELLNIHKSCLRILI